MRFTFATKGGNTFATDRCAFVVDVATIPSRAEGRIVVVSAEIELCARVRRDGAAVIVDRRMLGRGLLKRDPRLGASLGYLKAPDDPVVVVPGDLAEARRLGVGVHTPVRRCV